MSDRINGKSHPLFHSNKTKILALVVGILSTICNYFFSASSR
jgi:hypothetical protein